MWDVTISLWDLSFLPHKSTPQPPLGHLAASSMPPHYLLQLDMLWALDLASLELNLSYLGRSTLHGAAHPYFSASSHLVAASCAPTPVTADLWVRRTFPAYLLFFVVCLYCASPWSPPTIPLLASRLHVLISPPRAGTCMGCIPMPCCPFCWFSSCRGLFVFFPLLFFFWLYFYLLVLGAYQHCWPNISRCWFSLQEYCKVFFRWFLYFLC